MQAVITVLKERGIPYRLTTHNSLLSQADIVRHLRANGLDIDDNSVLLTSSVLAHWLRKRTNRATVFLLGSQQVRHELERHGLRVIDDPREIGYLCDYVVAGAFPDYAYAALRDAYRCYEAGAQFVGVDHYAVYTMDDQVYPGGGPTVAALSRLFDKGPTFIASDDILHHVTLLAQRHAVEPEHMLVVTDTTSDRIGTLIEKDISVLAVAQKETTAAEIDGAVVVHDTTRLADVMTQRFFPS